MRLINIGYGSMISSQRLVAIVAPESAPIKRLVQEARDKGTLIDATYGKKTQSVVIMDSDHVILSAKSTDSLSRSADSGDDKVE